MLDPKYIPLFIGGFIAWICFMIFVGWITSRGKNEGSSFLTGGGNLGFFLIFCTVGATMIGTGSSMGAIGNGFYTAMIQAGATVENDFFQSQLGCLTGDSTTHQLALFCFGHFLRSDVFIAC